MAELVLVDLRGPGAMAVGALQALATGNEDRELTQEWALAIFEDGPGGADVQGIIYPGAHDGGDCIALWAGAGALEVVQSPLGHVMDMRLKGETLDQLAIDMTNLQITTKIIRGQRCTTCSSP
jgi:hypothetical protein